MKTARALVLESDWGHCTGCLEELAKAAQADALESAAQIADVYDWEDANDRIRALKPGPITAGADNQAASLNGHNTPGKPDARPAPAVIAPKVL